MKIDLTCPVELWQYAMPTETDAECTFVMNNLSDKVVTSVQVTLNCFDCNDELLFRQTERMQGLKAGVGERFTVVVLPSEWKGVEGVDLVIEKVWFDDSTIWRKGNAPLTYYMPNALQPGRALDELRFVAGKDASGYPQMQDMVWMCVCGRPNALDSDRCCRCERRRDAVFASFSRENVNHIIAAHEQKLAETARKAREENNILQENQEKQRAAKRRRRKLTIRWLTTLVLLAAAAVIIIVWGIPTVKYYTAADLLADGHYDEASAAFAEMGDYRDAMTQVLECDYQKAMSLYKQGDAEAMEQAEDILLALEDYSDSADHVMQVGYDLGHLYLEAGSYELAVEKFEVLGNYLDSHEMRNESVYRQAKSMMDGGSHEAARVLFAGLGNYSDAADMVNECTCRMAEMQMKAEEYHAALELLLPIENYADASELVGQCYYALAEAEEENGAFEAAGEWFLKADDYANAQERANECFYNLAQEKRKAGEYERAMELFLRVPEYRDSVEQAQGCVYDQAMGLMESGDLANAAALLESITVYSDARKQLDECRFRMAEEALQNGDAERAERLLEGIAEHKGLETQLKKVRYQLAEAALEAGDYQDALDRYELLDNYKDSRAREKQCRYALANAALEKGEYETAISLLEELGSYKESKSLLGDAQYQRAMAMKDAGNINGAIAVLEKLNSKEAKDALEQLKMEEAIQLENAGIYDEAAEMFKALKGNAEAEQHYDACRYQLAVQLKESGDLPGAAAAFHELGSYEDAAEQSENCYNEYYGQVAQSARDAAQQQDHASVINILRGFEMNVLSKTYKDLPQMLAESCLVVGDQLYADGKPYEAIPYYQHANVQDKLDRRAYLIIGEWESATGKTAVFRTDGTCSLMGEELYFRVSNFSLYTGESPGNMTITHKISVLDKAGMSLRDQRNGEDVLYKLSRVGDFELPQMELPEQIVPQPEETSVPTPEPAVEPAATPQTEMDEADELLVTEDTDAANE